MPIQRKKIYFKGAKAPFFVYTVYMMMCPICKEKLVKEGRSWRCAKNHCFDIAKQGYVNFSRKQKSAGDNKEMVQARTAFLENDYYDFMRKKVAQIVEERQADVLLDIGCGQGYYTSVLPAKEKYGMDLSKEAVSYAARHDRNTQYIVGSIYEIPLQDESVDVVTSIFTPIPQKEVLRVLKKNGIFIVVGPGPKHCWELKQQLYSNVYENPKAETQMDGYVLLDQFEMKQTENVEDVWALFEMTPYRFKSPKEGMEKVERLDHLEVTFDFVISIWGKYGKK